YQTANSIFMKIKNYLKKGLLVLVGLLFANIMVHAQQPSLQYFKYYDKRAVNVFETSKIDTVNFDGLKIRLGANFTQGYQSLQHSNEAKALLTGTSLPTLIETSPGSGSFVNMSTGVPVAGISQLPGVLGGYTNASGAVYTNNNQLYDLASGFPLAMANLNLDFQLADGVRV